VPTYHVASHPYKYYPLHQALPYPLWQDWKVDPDFITSVKGWKNAHPKEKDSIINALFKVEKVLKEGKDLADFVRTTYSVPSNPSSIRSVSWSG
jgi:hypothetical protein